MKNTCGAFVSTQTAHACFRLLIVEPFGRAQILGCATQIKNRPKRSVLNSWRTNILNHWKILHAEIVKSAEYICAAGLLDGVQQTCVAQSKVTETVHIIARRD